MAKHYSNRKFVSLILSAGLGTRMRPLTDFIPKPIVPICGKARLLTILDKIKRSVTATFAINLHYKGEQIKSTLKENCNYYRDLHFFYEKDILGTGGAILNCKDLLSSTDFFLLHNGDIITNADINSLIDFSLRSDFDAVLLLIDGTENKIFVDESAQIRGIQNFCGEICENRKLYTYSGIAVFKQNSFDYFPNEVKPFPLIEVFAKMIEKGKLGGFIQNNIFWRDIGSLEKYFAIHEEILSQRKILPEWVKVDDVPIPRKLTHFPAMRGFISLCGSCKVEKGASAENCIILDGAVLKKNTVYKNEVIGKNFTIHRDTNTILSVCSLSNCDFRKTRISSLPEQGSNRKFYRISSGRNSEILMISSPEDQDFSRFITIAKYLDEKRLGTPKIYEFSSEKFFVKMEDLGDLTLNQAILSTSNKEAHRELLKKAIRYLVQFQLKTLNDAKVRVNREFGLEGLRWESNYFCENFLAKFAKVDLTDSKFKGLNEEFDEIANFANSCPQVLCHRDFQSKNIMLKSGNIRIVDFQGARIGPIAYDLMSLLRDAYLNISEEMINELIQYYLLCCKRSGLAKIISLKEENLKKYTSVAGLQRNMQALGAFCFLSLVKGKKFYLEYIPRGFYNLKKSIQAFKMAYGEQKLKTLSFVISETEIKAKNSLANLLQ